VMVTGGLPPLEEEKSARVTVGGLQVELPPVALGIVVIGEKEGGLPCLVATGGRMGFSFPEGASEGNSEEEK
jgi:hypothetical protein